MHIIVTDMEMFCIRDKINKGEKIMKFYIGGNKIVGLNNNSIFGWSAVCEDGILVENGNRNGTDIK